ncbi:hypothetical protein JCM6882_005019 [Rhodosporidiobolus microsporus]
MLFSSSSSHSASSAFVVLSTLLSLASPATASSSHSIHSVRANHNSAPARLETRSSTGDGGVRVALNQRRRHWFQRLKASSGSSSSGSGDGDGEGETDGVVEFENLQMALTSVKEKYQEGSSRIYWKTGRKLPGFSLDVFNAWSKLALGGSGSGGSGKASWHWKRQKDPLTNYLDGSMWAGSIEVGTPAKPFNIVFDTGSADLWIPGPSVTGYDTFNPNASSSANATNERFNVFYGDGSMVSGPVYTDVVTVAGLSAQEQHIGVIDQMGTDFGSTPIDGILGMAYESLSNINEPPFFQTLFAQGAVVRNLFSFTLGDQSEGELYLGGMDQSKFQGELNFSPVTEQGYWMIQGDAGTGGTKTSTSASMIVDTGTTLIIAPKTDAAHFFRQVPTARRWKNGYYAYQCDQQWTAEFTFNGQVYTVSSEYLNLGLTELNSSECVAAIAGQDIGVNAWILGGVFLRNVYTTFSFEQNAVGFAPLA